MKLLFKKKTKRKNQIEEKGMQNDDQKRDGYLFGSRDDGK